MGPACPHPEEEILLADDSWIKAKDIQVGDKVKTLTAKDFKAGEYEVTRVDIIDNKPRCEVFFKDSKSIISSYSHPYAVEDKGFVEAQDIKAGDTVGDLIVTEVKPLDWGSVVSLSVDEAETYMLKGGSEDKPVALLSHNKSLPPMQLPKNWTPDPNMQSLNSGIQPQGMRDMQSLTSAIQPQGQGRVPDWAIQHMQGQSQGQGYGKGQGQPQGQGLEGFQDPPSYNLGNDNPRMVGPYTGTGRMPQSNIGGGAQTQTLNPVSPTNYNTYGNNMPVGFRYGGGIRSLRYNG